MASKHFETDDLVWAKMKGYPPWPGKIMVPPEDAKSKPKKSHHYVFFFGSNNHAWIPDDYIELHNVRLIETYGKRKGGLFSKAVQAIKEGSKGIAKYHTSTEITEVHKENDSNVAEIKRNVTKTTNGNLQNQSKSPQDNSVSQKMKRKLPLKKVLKTPSLQKKATGKRASSPDQSESDSVSASFSLDDTIAHSPEACGSSSAKFAISDLAYSALNALKNKACHKTALPHEQKYVQCPDSPPIDLMYKSDVFKKKKIEPTNKKIGFLGLSKMGQGIVKNLHHSGHSLIIWNETPLESAMFAEELRIEIAATPADVVEAADITFSCVEDSGVAKQLVENCGILREIERSAETKGYVEMSPVDPVTSQMIGTQIRMKGGCYLEAPICGSRVEAIEGTLFIVTAGDKMLYDDCQSCLDAIAKDHFFASAEVGTASKLNVVHDMLIGSTLAAIGEALALISEVGLKGEDFVDLLRVGDMSSIILLQKAKAMVDKNYVPDITVKKMQQSFNVGLSLGHEVSQRTAIFSMANESYKVCESLNYENHDVSAVIEATKQ